MQFDSWGYCIVFVPLDKGKRVLGYRFYEMYQFFCGIGKMRWVIL
jgi:hypothetical protein